MKKDEKDQNIFWKEKIIFLKKERNAIILGHYYTLPEVQDISDYVGDSLGLSQEAAKTNADVILFAGVYFMAETAKIICPDKKVLIPDVHAGCSLSDSIKPEDFKQFIDHHPDHLVISYINTTAEIKALSDIICTSSNAMKIIESIPLHQKILFAPDRNLGNYISSVTGRKMVIWDGACHVHEQFSLERILDLKKQYPEAEIIAHPECKKQILLIADHIGSTSSLLNYSKNSKKDQFIIVTEPGIIHQMRKECPEKMFIPAPPEEASCACSDCNFMKLNTIEKIYLCLKDEQPEIKINEELRKKAEKSILRMIEIS